MLNMFIRKKNIAICIDTFGDFKKGDRFKLKEFYSGRSMFYLLTKSGGFDTEVTTVDPIIFNKHFKKCLRVS